MKVVQVMIPASFLAAAAWMGLDSSTGLPEIPATRPVAPELLSTAPRRTPMVDPPYILVAGQRLRCSECHALFESRPETPGDLLRHEDLAFDHGKNNLCLNCHAPGDRDKLVLHGGETVDFARVVEVCAKCHGPTWRDWERGMHGRTTGTWVSGAAEQRRLGCTECHDPHVPAYEPMRPLPGPNTLRMKPTSPEHHETDERKQSPLLHWIRASESGHGAPAADHPTPSPVVEDHE